MLGAADQQAERRAHRAQVRPKVDDVGDEKQQDNATQHPWGVMATEVLGDASPRDTADPRADRLDHRHEREAEQHGPGEPVAELGADLAVGCDAAWVVIRSAGHQAGSEALEEAGRLRRGHDGRNRRGSTACVCPRILEHARPYRHRLERLPSPCASSEVGRY